MQCRSSTVGKAGSSNDRAAASLIGAAPRTVSFGIQDESTETTNDVTITYCKPFGYEKRAKEAADALHGNLSITARLLPAKGSIFEVRVNAEIVAKRVKGHFPDIDEIVEAVSAAVK